ncbi:MAG: hypothetical protein Q9M29_01335, partial [Mariprofundaceae bacterium]|nr:hypothetical protein [Mariprofundaceae bacterium]
HGGWGCPHEENGRCRKVPGRECDPGMKGCILFGSYSFSSEEKNISRRLQTDTTRQAKTAK